VLCSDVLRYFVDMWMHKLFMLVLVGTEVPNRQDTFTPAHALTTNQKDTASPFPQTPELSSFICTCYFLPFRAIVKIVYRLAHVAGTTYVHRTQISLLPNTVNKHPSRGLLEPLQTQLKAVLMQRFAIT
jgi:hypothetical protein